MRPRSSLNSSTVEAVVATRAMLFLVAVTALRVSVAGATVNFHCCVCSTHCTLTRNRRRSSWLACGFKFEPVPVPIWWPVTSNSLEELPGHGGLHTEVAVHGQVEVLGDDV